MDHACSFPLLKLAVRLFSETKPRVLWKFIVNFLFRGAFSASAFKKRSRAGDPFPAFIVVSVTNEC
ncbi:MAG: hypothetical protein KAG97_09590, partial [Victivallales bacterium]|nr:hypothetical protein [Victivallales bacterium]